METSEINKPWLTHKCLDCDKLCHKRAIRCKSCARKAEHNPNWQNLPKLFCVDCHAPLCKSARSMHVKRCAKCSIKFQLQGNPENHPRFNKPHTEATKQKISLKAQERLKDKTKHPMWQGGMSYAPYSIEFNKKLKRYIFKRDSFCCQNCSSVILQQQKHLFLSVHHIDYDKQNCTETNLISLCNICNSQANANRDYWYAYYAYIMENDR